jgi:hypothetical protein
MEFFLNGLLNLSFICCKRFGFVTAIRLNVYFSTHRTGRAVLRKLRGPVLSLDLPLGDPDVSLLSSLQTIPVMAHVDSRAFTTLIADDSQSEYPAVYSD